VRAFATRALELAARCSSRRAGAAVVYHRVGQPPGDPALRLDPALDSEVFAAQVRLLARRYRIVPASRLQEAVRARRRGGRVPVAITFDDDLRSHIEEAAPRLRAAGVPATFFLCGASLDEPASPWWQRFDRALDRGLRLDDPRLPSDPAAAAWVSGWGGGAVLAAAEAIVRLRPAKRDAFAEALLERAGPDPADAGLRASEVRALAQLGFELGFHTRRHDAMTLLEDEALARAFYDGRERLETLVGRRLDTIAYPHGRADDRVAAAAASAGFEIGYTTAGTVVRAGDRPLLLGRLSAPYTSAGELAAKLARALAPHQR